MSRFAKNTSWAVRKALKVLTDSYGPSYAVATVGLDGNPGTVEVGVFAGTADKEWSETLGRILVNGGDLDFYLPNGAVVHVDLTRQA